MAHCAKALDAPGHLWRYCRGIYLLVRVKDTAPRGKVVERADGYEAVDAVGQTLGVLPTAARARREVERAAAR